MKKTVIAAAIILTGCSNIGERNLKNLHKISVGMKVSEVYLIMGTPDSVFAFDIDKGYYRLMFTPPFLAADNLYIFIDSKDSIVTGINDGS